MNNKKSYDSTVARVAGNIASGLVKFADFSNDDVVVQRSVRLARAIILQVELTEPRAEEKP